MELTAADLWTRVLESARAGIPEQSYRTWLSGTSASALTDAELLVEAPSQFHVEWIEDKYGPMLSELTRRVMGRPLRIAFRSSKLPSAALPLTEPTPPEARTNTVPAASASGSIQAHSSTPSGRTSSGSTNGTRSTDS